MVAYSFKQMFAPRILDGTKRQTVRSERKRHARIGEELQLYTAMRTKHCKLIGRATCVMVQPIRLDFGVPAVTLVGGWKGDCNMFARLDGFEDWSELEAFWRAEHPQIFEASLCFEGVRIQWGPLI